MTDSNRSPAAHTSAQVGPPTALADDRPRCGNCLRLHGPLDACALGVLAGVVRDRWEGDSDRPRITAALLERVNADALWDRVGPAVDWLEGELQRLADHRRYALVVVVDAVGPGAAREATDELMSNTGSLEEDTVFVGGACEISPEPDCYETVAIQLRAEGVSVTAYPSEEE